MHHADGWGKLERREVDWFATWALIESLIRTERVEVIFLERKFFYHLRKAAQRLGASDHRIAEVLRHVRHSKGHTSHIHVRFECSPDAPKCRQGA